jgi:chromate transporter
MSCGGFDRRLSPSYDQDDPVGAALCRRLSAARAKAQAAMARLRRVLIRFHWFASLPALLLQPRTVIAPIMMSLIGWKLGGLTGALASAVAICGPSCTVAFISFRLGHRFRDMPWQRIKRRGLVPVTVGIVIASSYVVARAADTGWQAAMITGAAVVLMLGTRINPLWILIAGGAMGGLGLF